MRIIHDISEMWIHKVKNFSCDDLLIEPDEQLTSDKNIFRKWKLNFLFYGVVEGSLYFLAAWETGKVFILITNYTYIRFVLFFCIHIRSLKLIAWTDYLSYTPCSCCEQDNLAVRNEEQSRWCLHKCFHLSSEMFGDIWK